MSSARSIRVFLLDDHELLRRGLRQVIDTEDGLEVVGEAGSAQEALEVVDRVRPDVAVLDVRLGDGNGIEVCREIRDRHPGIACLILTSFAEQEPLFEAIMAGAAGYLLKDVRGADVVDAIRTLGTGGSLLDPSITNKVLDLIRTGGEAAPLASLTAQERKVLELIGEGLSNRDIAGRLHLAEQTVKNYVSTVLTKLGMERRTQAAIFAARLSGDERT